MDEAQELVERAEAYAACAGLKISTVSRKLLGNGIRIGELKAGKSLRVDTLVRAKRLLDKMEAAA